MVVLSHAVAYERGVGEVKLVEVQQRGEERERDERPDAEHADSGTGHSSCSALPAASTSAVK
jgi:hypothetical protein